jgi:hypothetical protein
LAPILPILTKCVATENVDGAFFLSPKRKLGGLGDLSKRKRRGVGKIDENA